LVPETPMEVQPHPILSKVVQDDIAAIHQFMQSTAGYSVGYCG